MIGGAQATGAMGTARMNPHSQHQTLGAREGASGEPTFSPPPHAARFPRCGPCGAELC